MVEVMFLGAEFCSSDQHSIRRPDQDTAGLHKQSSAGFLFQLGPQLVGPLNQRDVKRMLEIGLPDDARQTVRRP